jgi:hypothetical protein
MKVTDVVRVLGIPLQTVTDHVKSNGFEFSRFSVTIRKELVAQQVIPIGAGRTPRFLQREAVESLVRFISTPETDAICKQLWEVAKAVQTGDIATAQAVVGLSEDDALDHLEQALVLARKFKKERDEATAELVVSKEETVKVEAKVTYMERNITDVTLDLSYKSFEVVRVYPTMQPVLRSLSEANKLSKNPTDREWTLASKSMHSMFGYWLKKVLKHETNLKWKTKKGEANIYSKSFIDELMAELGHEKVAV